MLLVLTHWGPENGCHFADDISIIILLYEKFSIRILMYVPSSQINNKPLSEPIKIHFTDG